RMPSLMSGPNAMGGSVNIVTGSSRELRARAFAQGWGNFAEVSASASGAVGDLYWTTGASYSNQSRFPMPADNVFKNDSGSYRTNSGSVKRGALVRLGWRPSADSEIALAVSHYDNDIDVPPNVHTDFPRWWRFTKWRKSLINIMHKFNLNEKWAINGNFYYEKYDNILDSYDGPEFNSQTKRYAFHSVYDDYGIGANLITTIDYQWMPTTRAGLRIKHDNHSQSSHRGETFRTFEARTISAAIEQEASFLANRLSIYWGAGMDWLVPVYADGDPIRDLDNSLNIQWGAAYQMKNNFKIHGHIARRNRFPTLKELYAELIGGYIPNPELTSENSINYELGAGYSLYDFNFRSALFINDVNDLIAVDYLPENIRSFRNIGSALYRGFELDARWQPGEITASLNYTYVYSENTTPGAESSIIEHIPRHLFNAALGYDFDYGASFRAEFEFGGMMYSFNSNTRSQQQISDYGVINIRADQRLFENYNVFVRINNLTDRYYETEWGIPAPGRQIMLGAGFELN
ncbi:MAG: TonB-dependent receptor, partial [Candidatus Kapaibacterium sp.]